MIAFDHVFVLARDVRASAKFLAEILGLPAASPCGSDSEMCRLDVCDTGAIQYHPTDDSVPGQHIAFRVDVATFGAVVNRLRERGITFGNDPEAQTNMRTDDFLGGHGRVFFRDPNDHLFEVIA